MRMIAAILECPFKLSILSSDESSVDLPIRKKKVISTAADERDMTIGEIYSLHEELSELEEQKQQEEEPPIEVAVEVEDTIEEPSVEEETEEAPIIEEPEAEQPEEYTGYQGPARKEPAYDPVSHRDAHVVTPKDPEFEPVIKHEDLEEDLVNGDVNPYTGHEYMTNSVRIHPNRIGYVQVYDRSDHKWTDMTEWAFLGYQERKKALLGKEYEPPIYLD